MFKQAFFLAAGLLLCAGCKTGDNCCSDRDQHKRAASYEQHDRDQRQATRAYSSDKGPGDRRVSHTEDLNSAGSSSSATVTRESRTTTPPNDAAPGAARTSGGADADFIRTVAQANLTEIELGRTARKNSQREDVRAYAQRMIDDHQTAQKDVLNLGRTKNWEVPTQLDATHRDMAARFTSLSGAEFDREYIDMMVKDHEEVIGKFESESRSGRDDDTRAMASRMLPTLREHLRQAQQLQSRLRDGRSG